MVDSQPKQYCVGPEKVSAETSSVNTLHMELWYVLLWASLEFARIWSIYAKKLNNVIVKRRSYQLLHKSSEELCGSSGKGKSKLDILIGNWHFTKVMVTLFEDILEKCFSVMSYQNKTVLN